MSDSDFVLKRIVAFEEFLRRRMDVEGTGLLNMAFKIEGRLPRRLIRGWKFMTNVRNDLVHSLKALTPETRKRFAQTAESCRQITNDFTKSDVYQRRDEIQEWLDKCPIAIDEFGKSHIVDELLRSDVRR